MHRLSFWIRGVLAVAGLCVVTSGCAFLQAADQEFQQPQEPAYPTGNQCYDACTVEYRECMNDMLNTTDESGVNAGHRACLAGHATCAEDC